LKLVSKRLKITRGSRVLRRIAGQGHNKAKMPGYMIRSRRRLQEAGEHPMIEKAIRKMYQVR
jgi:hypothetical protein